MLGSTTFQLNLIQFSAGSNLNPISTTDLTETLFDDFTPSSSHHRGNFQFSRVSGPSFNIDYSGDLKNVVSSVVVPEPNTATLLVLGLAGMGMLRRAPAALPYGSAEAAFPPRMLRKPGLFAATEDVDRTRARMPASGA